MPGHLGVGAPTVGLPPCTRLLADHKRKGKRTREAGRGGRYELLPAGSGQPWPGAGRALPLHHPPRSFGSWPSLDAFIYPPHGVSAARPPVIYTLQWPADSPRPEWRGRGAPIPAGSQARGGGEGGGWQEDVGRQFLVLAYFLKNTIKTLWVVSNPLQPGLQFAGGGE